MKKRIFKWAAIVFLSIIMGSIKAYACTNLLVTKGASSDGSVMITYACDGEFLDHLRYTPAADHKPGDLYDISNPFFENQGKIRQVAHTYSVVGHINEHQLAIGETTFNGREELHQPGGLLEYFTLMNLALQRAKTAREAIKVITDLVAEYGYASTGESFSIGDTEEAWILEIIGTDSGKGEAVWVAVKVPDGYISSHANKARIGEFPLDDPENCLYSDNVVTFAAGKGYYDPASGKPFRFCDAYCPSDAKNRRYTSARVWSIFRRAAPSENFSPDYHRGVDGAQPYPLWIKPDKKLSLADVFALMRDHYEGTEYDMTKGVDAGPHNSAYRWRPMTWTVDGVEYAWERPISTQQTAFSFVSQSRSSLPNAVGGVLWYGVDDTYFTCYVPLYCGINDIPKSFATGDRAKFSWDSAWWVFNFASNYANLRYAYMVPEIQALQSKLEGSFMELQPVIEKTAMALHEQNPELMIRYLTTYSVTQGEMVVSKWRELGEHLITKYNDGYLAVGAGFPKEKGYPEEWLRRVLKARPDQFRLPVSPE